MKIWDLQQGALERTLAGHKAVVFGVQFSGDGRFVTSAGDTTVRVWDRLTGMEVLKLEHHQKSIYNLAVHPSGRWMATGGQDGEIRFWGYGSARGLSLESK